MFDFGFSEILLIFLLALIVLGPEKLPRVAAQVGRWLGRARGMARQFREQLEEEVNLEDARKSQGAMTRTATPQVTLPPVPPDSQVLAPTAPADTQAPPPAAAAQTPQAQPEQQITYPDHYSHAHPTDELGRDISIPDALAEPATPDPRQQDWVGGVAPPAKPVSSATDAAYASPNERGT
jgi:sec-independent protein translocase protein TatB